MRQFLKDLWAAFLEARLEAAKARSRRGNY